MSDIVERLRERPSRYATETEDQAKERRQQDREEGADTIATLRAEIERLRAALEPFACNCRVLDCEQRIIPSKQCPRKVARAALAQEKQDLVNREDGNYDYAGGL